MYLVGCKKKKIVYSANIILHQMKKYGYDLSVCKLQKQSPQWGMGAVNHM
jgi:hypothetical protein